MLSPTRWKYDRTAPGNNGGWTGQFHFTKGATKGTPPPFSAHYHEMENEDEVWSRRITRVFKDSFFQRSMEQVAFGTKADQLRKNMLETSRFADGQVRLSADEISTDAFYGVREILAPDNKRYTRRYLEGKIVGVCLFNEKARSHDFLRLLGEFQRQHSPDFVGLCISLGWEEELQMPKRNGLCHLLHSSGGSILLRNIGYRQILPPPRVYIVDGSTGNVITSTGFTAITMRFSTCFREWLHGRPGHYLTDVVKVLWKY